jgi:hypothetical protein
MTPHRPARLSRAFHGHGPDCAAHPAANAHPGAVQPPRVLRVYAPPGGPAPGQDLRLVAAAGRVEDGWYDMTRSEVVCRVPTVEAGIVAAELEAAGGFAGRPWADALLVMDSGCREHYRAEVVRPRAA